MPNQSIPESVKARLLILKETLIQHGYNEKNIRERKIDIEWAGMVRMKPVLEHCCKARDPLNTLVKLFLAGLAVDPDHVGDVFTFDDIDALVPIDILKTTGEGKIRSKVMIFPHGQYNFLCDFKKSGADQEPVYSPGFDSIRLAELRLRKRFHKALDLCSGSGIQAILASEHCGHVTGVDINPRALYFSNMNLILNAVDNVEFVLGNLYKPVQQERFDFIMANPPFVICPSGSVKYRDGGVMGDAVLKGIMEGLPRHLEAGGYCQIVTQLSEFEDISHEEEIKKFARLQGYETLILAAQEYDNYRFSLDQYGNFTDYAKYTSKVTDFLDHLDAVKFLKGFLCIITFKNSGAYRYKKLFAINRPVLFDLDPALKLKEFFRI